MEFKLYNKNHSRYFLKEKRKLKKLGKFRIHHIGSTAILGMSGKGEIDILVIAKDKKQKKDLIEKLKEIGYKKHKIKDKNKLFFSKEKDGQIYNLHLVVKEYKKARDQIKFKDYIIRNPAEFKRYLKLKKENLKKANHDRVKYRKLKEAYFKEIMEKIR